MRVISVTLRCAAALALLVVACRAKPTDARIAQLAIDAATGDSVARYNLAVELYRGDSVTRDYSKAAALWKQAMEQGSVDAINNYAYLLYYGLGVTVDPVPAVALWRKAALLGQPESHAHLGDALLAGVGVAADTAEAAAHYRAAVTLGMQSSNSVDKVIAADAGASLSALPALGPTDARRADSLFREYTSVPLRKRP